MFTGKDGMLTQTINSRDTVSVSPQNVPDFDSEELFGALASEDTDGAVQLARFPGRSPAHKRHHRHRPLSAQSEERPCSDAVTGLL